MSLTYAEFCAGYGGLGLAVEEVFGAELKWYSEFDAAPSKIMAHHWPGVPNHGDMTAIDWAAVEPVDILSGGTPCQDLSAAGRRKGMTEGTRSNLWVHMREAIAVIKPTFVVWENVRGAYSASASSDLEQCPGCVGDTSDGRVFLRALGRVLGDLSDLGYDGQWRGLRAADVGACHGRYRVFVIATYTGSERGAESHLPAGISTTGIDRTAVPHEPNTGHLRPEPTRADIFKGDYWGFPDDAPTAYARSEAREQRTRLREGIQGVGRERLANDRGTSPAADAERLRGERRRGHRNLAGAAGAGEAHGRERERHGNATNDSHPTNWGDYEPAIRRWERVLGRSAPRPTEPTGRNGGHRLSPRFTEWMMGLDEGWVTAPEIGLTRNEQLKACGNGVVPQQAIAALRDMLAYSQNLERAA